MLKKKFENILRQQANTTPEEVKAVSSLLFEEVINWIHKYHREETLLEVDNRLRVLIHQVLTQILEETKKVNIDQ